MTKQELEQLKAYKLERLKEICLKTRNPKLSATKFQKLASQRSKILRSIATLEGWSSNNKGDMSHNDRINAMDLHYPGWRGYIPGQH